MDAGRPRPARSQIEGPMMGEGRGVETVRVWVNVVTKVAIARPRRRRVALVVRRRVLGGCPRPMLLPTAAAAGAAAGAAARALGRPSAPNVNRRDGPSRPERRAEQNAALSDNSQTSSQTRGSPARARAGHILRLRGSSQTMRRPSDQRETPPVHDPRKIRRA